MPSEELWKRFYRELRQDILAHCRDRIGHLTSESFSWLAIAQMTFHAWFQFTYYRISTRKLRKHGPDDWALVPIKFDDKTHDWPVRLGWGKKFPTLGVDRRNFLTASNYFRCWQRLCFRVRILTSHAQILRELSLRPIALLRGLDDQLISRILGFIYQT
jgi:hypothetical protein